MKKALLSLTLLSLCTANVFAQSSYNEVKHFDEIERHVKKLGSSKQTLVVMDDDATLTMMSCPDRKQPEFCQYLGGPAWFAWQQDQVEQMAQPRVADTFDELLTISGLLFATNDMPYTDKKIPQVLDDLVKDGVRLMVETARGDANISATERQFSVLNTKSQYGNNLGTLISNNSLMFNDHPSLPSPYRACQIPNKNAKTPISYRNGVMYLSGQNKGVILKCMLERYNSQSNNPITKVVFLDDTKKNVKDVAKAFEGKDNGNNKYNVHALYYTLLEAHKDALTKGEMARIYQDNAMERWQYMKEGMNRAQLNSVANQ